MPENDYYAQALHGPYEVADIGDLVPEGPTLRGCKLAYATHDRLSAAKDNAILVTTWFSGTSKIMEQAYIGPGRALDPDKYFIVVANQIGSGLSSSPHNTPVPWNMGSFPQVRIGDDVCAQHRLLTETLGIRQLQLVTGASMGAQQTYEWAARFPEMVQRAAPIAGTARTTPHNFLLAEAGREAITSDPAWAGGWYAAPQAVRAGLKRHARFWAVVGFSPGLFQREAWRGLGFSSLEDFLAGMLDATFLPMDPNALVVQAWKWQRADVGRLAGGNLAQALGRIRARTLVMPIDTDFLFPPQDCEVEQRLIPGSEFRVLRTEWGHIGVMGMDPGYLEQVDQELKALLAAPA
jgi:homoserine O-acetyltransferase/O-succinyltransferase